MRTASRVYVALVCVLAICAVAGAYLWQPTVATANVVAVLLLCALAAAGELMQFALPRGTRGSISFVPFLACVILSPTWVTSATILAFKLATELTRRVAVWKVVFNAAQYVFAISLSLFVYRALGGVGLLGLAPIGLAAATKTVGVAAIAATIICYFANGVLVSIVLSLNSGSPIGDIWRDVKNPAAASLDVLAGPMVFMFSWVYADFGPIAAVAAWVPLIGYRHAQTTNLELEQTNRELLELMVKSLEARDPYTSGHSRRVQNFSTIIARSVGLTPREVERVSRAALLHDVGKIHERYAPILTKSERLTSDEWAVMRQHPVDGATLISTMTGLHDIVPAIRHHHENWDGTGYPDGLAGELIPLASRIIRFADTIDAMISERPYRAPLTEAQVRAEIVKCRGSQFDPAIADQLLSSSLWSSLFVPVVVPSDPSRSSSTKSRPHLSVINADTVRPPRAGVS